MIYTPGMPRWKRTPRLAGRRLELAAAVAAAPGIGRILARTVFREMGLERLRQKDASMALSSTDVRPVVELRVAPPEPDGGGQ